LLLGIHSAGNYQPGLVASLQNQVRHLSVRSLRIDRGFVADHTRCALDNVSDLLRSLNHELGHPINTFITTSAVVDRVLRDQSLVDGSFDGPHHLRCHVIHLLTFDSTLLDPSYWNFFRMTLDSWRFSLRLVALNWAMWVGSLWTGEKNY